VATEKALILGLFQGICLGLKNFLFPELKYGSRRCFSPGSFAVLSRLSDFSRGVLAACGGEMGSH